MTLNWDVNIGTIVTILIAAVTTLIKLRSAAQDLELKTATRHAENTVKLENLECSHQEMKGALSKLGETQKECQRKISETREMVIRLDEANKRARD